MVKYQVNMHDDGDGSENCVDVHSAKDLFRTIHLCEGGGHVKNVYDVVNDVTIPYEDIHKFAFNLQGNDHGKRLQ